MIYVYACNVDTHPQQTVRHGMREEPEFKCEVCGVKMHRVPQRFSFYHNPGQVLLDKMDERYRILKLQRSKG